MLKISLTVLLALMMLGCLDENSNEVTRSSSVIRLETGLYVKEYKIGEQSRYPTRYIFIQCTTDGTPLCGLAETNSAGETTISTTTILADSCEYKVYLELRKKYERYTLEKVTP